MGREIRKVAKNWQHPKQENGNYQPVRDQFFEDAFTEWDENRKRWISGEDTNADKYKYPKTNAGFIDWNGGSPEPEYYRSVKWTDEEACCFQMYENVSEGTPVSPVFDSLLDLENWLVNTQGHSRTAAHNFCESGYAPSFTMQQTSQGMVMKSGVDTCE